MRQLIGTRATHAALILCVMSGTAVLSLFGVFSGTSLAPQRAAAAGPTVTSIGAGNIHACAGMSDGTARCWGSNGESQLGNAAFPYDAKRPVPVAGLTGAGTLDASNGAYHTCVLAGASTIKCWGSNSNGALGIGSFGGYFASPQSIAIPGVTQVSSDFNHTCAIGTAGAVSCWGSNSHGQLGDGTTTDRAVPVSVLGLPGPASDVDAGLVLTCAVVSGDVWCWGWSLGVTPVQILGIANALDVAVGSGHLCAVVSGGIVKCWGDNSNGQLGNGTLSATFGTAVQASGLSDAATIDTGGAHTCAVRSSGAVACWGANGAGQLGEGTTTDRTTPSAVTGLTNAAGIATGGAFTCARTAVDGAKCWGSNFYGTVGDCTLTNRLEPVDVEIEGKNCDSDGDALTDYWEETGDLDLDGDVDLDLPAMGANPYVKDLFVEIDWMSCEVAGSDCAPGHNDRLEPLAAAAIITNYWCGPVRIVAHLDAGPTSIMNPTSVNCSTRTVSGPMWGALAQGGPFQHRSTAQRIFDPDTRGPNRQNVFHLTRMQHAVEGQIGTSNPNTGWGEYPGDETWLGLGAITFPRPVTNSERWQSQTVLFIHEMGHNLGLGHGGHENEINYKPNYLSSMNYMFSSMGVPVNGGAIHQHWEYSRSDLVDLPEVSLPEQAGLEPDAGVIATGEYGTRVLGTGWICPNGRGIDAGLFWAGFAYDARTNVDFNCSGAEQGAPAGSCVDTLDNDLDTFIDQVDSDCTFQASAVANVGGGVLQDAGPEGQSFAGSDDYAILNFSGAAIGNPYVYFPVPWAGAPIHGDGLEFLPMPDSDGDSLLDSGELGHGTNANDPDSDDDGLEDGFEVGSVLSDPLDADTDNDLVMDGDEVENATDPLDPDTDDDSENDATDNCPSAANLDQLNADQNFIDNSPPYNPSVDDKTWPDSDVPGDACDVDDDNDGIDDDDEASGAACGAIGTNSLLRDTDADRFLDGAECILGTDPTVFASKPLVTACGGTTDADGDKLTERIEVCFYGTDPANNDTDGDKAFDGAKDGCEAASLNGDRTVNVADMGMLATAISKVAFRVVSVDVNKDGAWNPADQGLLASYISPSGQCPPTGG